MTWEERIFWAVVAVIGGAVLFDGCRELCADELPARPTPVSVDAENETVAFDRSGLEQIVLCFDTLGVYREDLDDCDREFDIAQQAFDECRNRKSVCETVESFSNAEKEQLLELIGDAEQRADKAERKTRIVRWVYGAAAVAGAALGVVGLILVGGSK